jgi:large subunit ribosomal protein L17
VPSSIRSESATISAGSRRRYSSYIGVQIAGHIETTVPKAKELRPFVERLITIAKRGLADGGAPTRALTARREVLRDIPNKDVVAKLFTDIAPRYATRPGGYTRLLRVGYRQGDAAEVAQVELLGFEYDPKAKAEKDAKPVPPPPLFTYRDTEAGAEDAPVVGTPAQFSSPCWQWLHTR